MDVEKKDVKFSNIFDVIGSFFNGSSNDDSELSEVDNNTLKRMSAEDKLAEKRLSSNNPKPKGNFSVNSGTGQSISRDTVKSLPEKKSINKKDRSR